MSFHDLDTPDTFGKEGESVEPGCPCADCCNGVSPRKNTTSLDDFYVRSLHAQYWGHAPPSKMAEVIRAWRRHVSRVCLRELSSLSSIDPRFCCGCGSDGRHNFLEECELQGCNHVACFDCSGVCLETGAATCACDHTLVRGSRPSLQTMKEAVK